MHTRFWWRIMRERNHLEDIGIDGKIILKWILGYGQLAGTCEHCTLIQ